MAVNEGELIIEITDASHSDRLGGWYKDLIGERFSVSMRNIMNHEYTVYYEGKFRIISMDDAKEIEK